MVNAFLGTSIAFLSSLKASSSSIPLETLASFPGPLSPRTFFVRVTFDPELTSLRLLRVKGHTQKIVRGERGPGNDD